MRLARGAIATRYLSSRTLASGSTSPGLRRKLPAASLAQVPSGSLTPFSTMTFSADMLVNVRVRRSSVKPMLVTSVPFAPALVTSVFAPEEFGSEQTYDR